MKLPTNIEFHNKSKIMNISYPDGDYELTYEFLRVFSPSADVQGTFSDGHDSGIYSWEWLEDLGKNKEAFWAAYLEDLKAAGASRDPNDPANEPFKEKPKSKCSGH